MIMTLQTNLLILCDIVDLCRKLMVTVALLRMCDVRGQIGITYLSIHNIWFQFFNFKTPNVDDLENIS